jgi:hypothetical protein
MPLSKPCAGNPHARFERGSYSTDRARAVHTVGSTSARCAAVVSDSLRPRHDCSSNQPPRWFRASRPWPHAGGDNHAARRLAVRGVGVGAGVGVRHQVSDTGGAGVGVGVGVRHLVPEFGTGVDDGRALFACKRVHRHVGLWGAALAVPRPPARVRRRRAAAGRHAIVYS